jgi:hypothetical protein
MTQALSSWLQQRIHQTRSHARFKSTTSVVEHLRAAAA